MDETGDNSISLEEYALDEVVRRFLSGNGRISATKLPENVSNKIYKRLSLERVYFTHEQIENLKQSLTITKAVVNGKKFFGLRDGLNLLEVSLLATQQLQELKLVNMRGPADIYMPDILETILASSKESLKTLSIMAGFMKFESNWVRVLQRIAPCLNALHFLGPSTYDRDLKELASMFPALIRLTWESSWMDSVNPISRLKNITSLNLAGVRFSCKKSLMAIFELSNLQELDISYLFVSSDNLRSRNLQHFLECKKVLPQLIFIDCSNNFLGTASLKTLIESHTRLKTISIIGNDLERIPPTLEREVQLLSIADVLTTMATVRFYSRKASGMNCLIRILIALNEQLEHHFNEGGPSLWSNPEVSGCFIDLFNYAMLSEENFPTNQYVVYNFFELIQRDPNFLLSRNQANQFIKNLDCLQRQPYSDWFPSMFCKLLTKQSILDQATVSNKSIIRSALVCQFMIPFQAADLEHEDRNVVFREMSRVCIDNGALCREIVGSVDFHLQLIHILRTIGEQITNDEFQIPPFHDYKGLIEILVKLAQISEKLAMLNKNDVLRVLSLLLVSPALDFEAVCYILRTIRNFLCVWNGFVFHLIDTADSRDALLNIRNREFEMADSLEIERLLYSILMAIRKRSTQNCQMEITEEWLDMHLDRFMPFLEADPERQGNHVGLWRRAARSFSRDTFLRGWAKWMEKLINAFIRS